MTFDSLLSEYTELKKQREADLARIEYLEKEKIYFEEVIRILRHRGFAPSSEKMSSFEEQMGLFNEIEEAAGAPQSEDESEQLDFIEVASHKKRRPKRKPLPKELPREVVVIELPESSRVCPHDGSALKVIGSEVSERLDVIPMQMKIIETKRLTYACPCCEGFMKTAPVPLSAIPKGIPTSGTLSFIATSKFCDGLSLYHLETMFARNQIEISRGSMAHWMIRVSELSQSVINILEETLMSGDYVQIDETTTQVLKENGKKPQTQSYMWVRSSPAREKPIVLFEYDPTRSGKVAERLLSEFKGRVQSDGFDGYNVLEKNPHIIRHGCMAHARRRFFEATKATAKAHIAKHGLKLIQKLYRIEDEVRDRDPDFVLKTRKEKSEPIIQDLRKLLDENLKKVPPKSTTGKALQYLNNEWVYLMRYTEDGRVHIDNNFVENKIRPFAVGRKRWLFSDTVEGAKASANLYSLVETAKANDLNPYEYLKLLFDQLPRATSLEDIERLLPWNVKTKITEKVEPLA